MATQADVRRIALSFPETEEAKDDFAFSVWNKGKLKGFAWVWKERVNPKKPRVPNDGVMAIRTLNLSQRDLILATDSKKFFTEPHYSGFPAVLVRLDAVTVADLKVLLADAWASQSPRELTKPDKPKAAAPTRRSARKGRKG
ncbi:MAG TPA: hypothetical protein VGH98_04505 [Gemmatimonadaceae bacterium]|jgi:hypothetical protein